MEKLDKDRIPNIANLLETQASPPFDPNREYSLPWQSGMTGIAWNEDVTGPVESIEQLLEDPKLKGKVTHASGDGGLRRARHACERRRSADGHRRGLRPGAVDRIEAAVDSGQIRRSRATTTRSR